MIEQHVNHRASAFNVARQPPPFAFVGDRSRNGNMAELVGRWRKSPEKTTLSARDERREMAEEYKCHALASYSASMVGDFGHSPRVLLHPIHNKLN